MLSNKRKLPETGLVVWVSQDQKKICVGLKGNMALVSIELSPAQAEQAVELFHAAISIVRQQHDG